MAVTSGREACYIQMMDRPSLERPDLAVLPSLVALAHTNDPGRRHYHPACGSSDAVQPAQQKDVLRELDDAFVHADTEGGRRW